MNDIKNLEQLRAEKARLRLQTKSIEAEIRNEINIFNNRIQPIVDIAEFTKQRIQPFVGGAVKAALPLIVGSLLKGKGKKASVWGMVGTLAIEYLAKNVNKEAIISKIVGFINTKKKRENEDDDYGDYDDE